MVNNKNFVAPSFKEEIYSDSDCSEDYDQDLFYNQVDSITLDQIMREEQEESKHLGGDEDPEHEQEMRRL